MKVLLQKYPMTIASILFVMVVLGSLFVSQRVDLTQDKRFTLSASTLQLLSEVDSTIHVEVLLDGDLPADYKKLSIAVKDILDE